MTNIDAVLLALAHPVRRKALTMLRDGAEICLCEFIGRFGVPQPNMSRHMGVLRRVGLVVDRRDARWVRYRLNPSPPAAVQQIVVAVLCLQALPKSDLEAAA